MHKGRAHRVDEDLFRGEFERDSVGEREHRGFGAVVINQYWSGSVTTDGGDVYDAPTGALLTHLCYNATSEPHRAVEVYVHAVPPIIVGRIERMIDPAVTRIIDEDIDSA